MFNFRATFFQIYIIYKKELKHFGLEISLIYAY